jgi:hypothetical protein
MDTPRLLLPGVLPHPLIQPDEHGQGRWAFSVVHRRIVAALLLPDAESARLVAHEIHAALMAVWAADPSAQRPEA